MTVSVRGAMRARRVLAVALGILLAAVAGPVVAAEVLPLSVSCGLPHPARNLAHGTFEGRTALRFVLDVDDTGECKADIARGGYNRAELRSENLPRDRKLKVSFDVFIPKGFAADRRHRPRPVPPDRQEAAGAADGLGRRLPRDGGYRAQGHYRRHRPRAARCSTATPMAAGTIS